MGDPRKIRKKYIKPSHPWKSERIEEESKLTRDFGLKNKREVWKARGSLENFRGQARDLLADRSEQGKKEATQLLNRLAKMNLLKEDATLDDVLGLSIDKILERRLQTQIVKKGLASTMKQARQFIVHGHVAVNDRKVTSPGYLVKKDDEKAITYFKNSPVRNIEITPKAPKPKGEEA